MTAKKKVQLYQHLLFSFSLFYSNEGCIFLIRFRIFLSAVVYGNFLPSATLNEVNIVTFSDSFPPTSWQVFFPMLGRNLYFSNNT